MNRPDYLSKYTFEWDLLEVVLCGRSSLDSKSFIPPLKNLEEVDQFLSGYGLDPKDLVNKAELFGTFQEAIQFIKRYFLKEGSEDGLDISLPNSIYMITDVSKLFLMATGTDEKCSLEEGMWSEVILKVMHTILHVDKDLRSNYFSTIQQQIFDRFYKYVSREDDNLFLGSPEDRIKIPLLDFETKSKKTRDSVIIKLLHKAENVAEELFDRIGIRIVTANRFDTLRVVKFLVNKNIIIPHNIKPSRSVNTIFDFDKLKQSHAGLVKKAIRNRMSEDEFLNALESEISSVMEEKLNEEKNNHTLSDYRSIQFTCRQLIKYKNPFLLQFNKLKNFAKENEPDSELTKRIFSMDMSLIARDIRFFYPYEVQILDQSSHRTNTDGEASHAEYKKQQIKTAMKRVFKNIINEKGLSIS